MRRRRFLRLATECAAVAGRARAGIAAFQSEDYFYLMTVGAREDGAEVRLESRIGGVAGIVAQALLEGPGGGDTAARNEEVADRVDTGDDPVQILLRIEARGALYAFSYAVGTTTGVEPDPEAALWQVLADSVDGTVLSTRRAGGFVGTYFGMFAYRD